ncbi:MAG: glutamine amidotransferase family protein [Endomicrobiia bacterium]
MKKFLDDRKIHIPSGCGVTGMMDTSGKLINGSDIVTSIVNMTERGNGLGSGYAGYGIYPEMKDFYCFHIMYQKDTAIEPTENYLNKNFNLIHKEPIPTKYVKTLKYIPILYRYFLKPNENLINSTTTVSQTNFSEEDFVTNCVMFINKEIEDAFVFSSGKNMGIFKGVGNPDEIAEFFKIYDYKAYIWTAHNRFPTNSVAWWGGSHPFGLLNWSVVHNGEISSYGINRRYLENFGYYCSLFTDTEVITYLVDLIIRKHKLTFDILAKIFSAPFWSQIERFPDDEKNFYKQLRIVYGPALVNGPFAIIIANNDSIIGLNDRTKLRPLVAGKKGTILYIASEESAIRCVSKELDSVWTPNAGESIVGKLEKSLN